MYRVSFAQLLVLHVPCSYPYLRASVAWLGTSGVQAWAWFSVRSAGRWSGDLLDAGGGPTPFGATWLDTLAPARRTPESRR
jgi:hypothetical protein